MYRSYEGQDRRKHKRLSVNFIATYKVIEPIKVRMSLKEDEVFTNMFDLSENGMAISTVHEIPPQTILDLKFTLINLLAYKTDNRSVSINLTGEVVYNIQYSRSEHRLGIRFRNVEPQEREAISNFVVHQSLHNKII